MSSLTTSESMTLHVSCTRLSEVLTCCPPGPDERENFHTSSFAGMVRPGTTSRSMPSVWSNRAENGTLLA